MNEKRLQWLLWDLDDTLYAPVPEYAAKKRILFVESYLQAAGGDMEFDQAELELRRKLAESGGLVLAVFKNMGLDPRKVLDRIAEIDRSAMFKPDPGLSRLFDELAAGGLRNALITNNIRRTTHDILHRLALPPERFDIEITMDDVHNIKPHPEPFTLFLKHSGAAPEQCLMIGDIAASDCVPAKRLGMHTLLVRKRPEALPPEVDFYLDDIYSLPEVLDQKGFL